jgi:hypothetical protein
MSTNLPPRHLDNHHRDTLHRVFRHPLSHNLEWRTVISLVQAVGSVEERDDGKVRLTVGSASETFDRHSAKDLDADQVVDLRRLLKNAGYEPGEDA